MAAHVATESFAARSQAVSEAHGAATGVFGGMLDRQAQVDRIKGVLAMLKRYESLFRLPTRIRCPNFILFQRNVSGIVASGNCIYNFGTTTWGQLLHPRVLYSTQLSAAAEVCVPLCLSTLADPCRGQGGDGAGGFRERDRRVSQGARPDGQPCAVLPHLAQPLPGGGQGAQLRHAAVPLSDYVGTHRCAFRLLTVSMRTAYAGRVRSRAQIRMQSVIGNFQMFRFCLYLS